MEATKLVAPKNKRQVEDAKTITSTIMTQIKYPSIHVYYSWGAHGFVYAVTENGNPCLRFKVNGMKFKGYVHVIYNYMDYYEVEFVSTRGNLKHRINECYCDNIQEVIDNYVEKIPEYVY